MEIKRLENISEHQDLDVELQFDLGGLEIFKIIKDEEGEEKLELIHSQPFRPNSDGSRSVWLDSQDAFAWFDIFKAESF